MKKRTLLCYAIASLSGIANAGTVELRGGTKAAVMFRYELEQDWGYLQQSFNMQCVRCKRNDYGVDKSNCLVQNDGVVPESFTLRVETPGYTFRAEPPHRTGWSKAYYVMKDDTWSGEREKISKVSGEVACVLENDPKYPYYALHTYLNGIGDLYVTGDLTYHARILNRNLTYSVANPVAIPGGAAGWMRVSYADELTLTAGETKKLVYDVEGDSSAVLTVDTTDIDGLTCWVEGGGGYLFTPGAEVKCRNDRGSKGLATGSVTVFLAVR